MSNSQSDAPAGTGEAVYSPSQPAIAALQNFFDAFNRVDKDEIVSALHFPHAVHSDGNDPTLYQDGEEFWGYLRPQFSTMREREGWAYSTLDHAEIINETPNTVQALIEFSRRTSSGEAYGIARGIWVVTKINGRWALHVRSTLPKSGNISALAGQPTNR